MNPFVPSLFKIPKFSPFKAIVAALVLVPIVKLVSADVFKVVPRTTQ